MEIKSECRSIIAPEYKIQTWWPFDNSYSRLIGRGIPFSIGNDKNSILMNKKRTAPPHNKKVKKSNIYASKPVNHNTRPSNKQKLSFTFFIIVVAVLSVSWNTFVVIPLHSHSPTHTLSHLWLNKKDSHNCNHLIHTLVSCYCVLLMSPTIRN